MIYNYVMALEYSAWSYKTPEINGEIKKFSGEQKEGLRKLGLVFLHESNGESIKILGDTGRHKFWSNCRRLLTDFEDLPSMKSEIAVNPNGLFLINSQNKTFNRQEEMVEKFSEEISRKVPGVKAVIGEVQDYAGLAVSYFDKTGEYLFGEKSYYNYTNTKTPLISNPRSPYIKGHFAIGGRNMDTIFISVNSVFGFVRVAPLIVPA